MIINQTIRNGFVTVNKTGAYFSLISAGGVVNVRLSEKGRIVLDTKMWVGMSIDKAIPFDEITIQGDDGTIEFWAGDVSMYQARSSLTGASAIRTSRVAVLGATKITGSDVTRTAVRLRTDKDIHLGGAGVNGAGWRLAAGGSEEIPVAGVLYAYKPIPLLDNSKTTFITTAADWEATTQSGNFWVSDDESVKLAWNTTGFTLRRWTLADGWIDHPDFITLSATNINIAKCWADGALYLFRLTAYNSGSSYNEGQMTLYRSVDNGMTFQQVAFIDWGAITDGTKINNSFTYRRIIESDGVLTWCCSGLAIGYNVTTQEVQAMESARIIGNIAFDLKSFAYLNSKFTSAIYLNYTSKKIMRTDDGVSWRELAFNNIEQFTVSDGGQYIAAVDSTGYLWLSNDAGETSVKYSASVWDGIKAAPVHIEGGRWFGFNNTTAKLAYLFNGVVTVVNSATGGGTEAADSTGQILDNGIVIRRDTGTVNTDKWQINISGDLTPARVEVMELLS